MSYTEFKNDEIKKMILNWIDEVKKNLFQKEIDLKNYFFTHFINNNFVFNLDFLKNSLDYWDFFLLLNFVNFILFEDNFQFILHDDVNSFNNFYDYDNIDSEKMDQIKKKLNFNFLDFIFLFLLNIVNKKWSDFKVLEKNLLIWLGVDNLSLNILNFKNEIQKNFKKLKN
jgi:hypothetical protein